jgi:hypothetical protein
MDIENNFREVSKLRKVLQDRAKVQYYVDSKKRLSKSIEKKFKTTFIGALSFFEELFGDEWGHKKPEHKLTPEQLEKRKLWEQVRTSVLNNGNNQLRSALTEISEYSVEWDRYKTNIPVKEVN